MIKYREEKIYDEICMKLGMKPEDIVFEVSGYEDDSKISPYLVLTRSERDFIWKNKIYPKIIYNGKEITTL